MLAPMKHASVKKGYFTWNHIHVSEFMEGLETDCVTPDGSRLRIRPLRSSDENAWLEFVNGLSPDSLYHRLFEVRKGMSHSDAVHYLDIDPEKRMAMVVVIPGEKSDRMVAIARYELIPDTKIGEFAIVVADDFQDKGVGTFLFNRLYAYAKSNGIEEFVAEVLQDNERMMELFRNSGLSMETRLESGTWLVRLRFT